MSEITPTKKRKAPHSAWRPGESGNPRGKPKGTKHKATQMAEALINGQAEEIIQTAVRQALAGDGPLLRAMLDRLAPAKKDSPIRIALPPLTQASDCPRATGVILEAVATGDLTPAEGQAVAGLVEAHRKSLETQEIESRVQALEAVLKEGKK